MTNTDGPLRALSSRTSWHYLLAAALLLCFANGRWIVPAAAWLAPAFLLLFLFSQPAGRGLLLGFGVQLISFFIAWRGMIPVPGPWYFVVAGVYASAYFLPFVVYRLLVPRPAGFVTTLLLPVSWVVIEFLFQRFITPYGSWMSLAYTQTGNLPFLQLAALTGLGGITFMMVWGAAVAAWVWMERANAARARLGAVIYVSILLAIMAWGALRIVAVRGDGESIRIAMIIPSPSRTRELNEAMRALPASGAADDADRSNILAIADGLNADLLRRSRTEARTGSKIIGWSETAARVTAGSESDFMREAGELAEELDVTLVMGVGAWRPGEQYAFENEVVVARSSGEILAPFRKAHPIAGQESSLIEAGDHTIKVFDTA